MEYTKILDGAVKLEYISTFRNIWVQCNMIKGDRKILKSGRYLANAPNCSPCLTLFSCNLVG